MGGLCCMPGEARRTLGTGIGGPDGDKAPDPGYVPEGNGAVVGNALVASPSTRPMGSAIAV